MVELPAMSQWAAGPYQTPLRKRSLGRVSAQDRIPKEEERLDHRSNLPQAPRRGEEGLERAYPKADEISSPAKEGQIWIKILVDSAAGGGVGVQFWKERLGRYSVKSTNRWLNLQTRCLSPVGVVPTGALLKHRQQRANCKRGFLLLTFKS